MSGDNVNLSSAVLDGRGVKVICGLPGNLGRLVRCGGVERAPAERAPLLYICPMSFRGNCRGGRTGVEVATVSLPIIDVAPPFNVAAAPPDAPAVESY